MDWHTVVAIGRVGYEYTSEEMEMDEALLLLLTKTDPQQISDNGS